MQMSFPQHVMDVCNVISMNLILIHLVIKNFQNDFPVNWDTLMQTHKYLHIFYNFNIQQKSIGPKEMCYGNKTCKNP